MLATSQEDLYVRWREVFKVTVHHRERVITLGNSWRTILRLYCPPELFGEAIERVQTYAAGGAQERSRQVRVKVTRSWPSAALFAWIALTAAATVASLVWQTEDMAGIALAAGGFVLLSWLVEGFLRRALAVIAVGASLLVLGTLAGLALRDRSFVPWQSVYAYEFDTHWLVVALIGGLTLLLLSGMRLFELAKKPGARKRTSSS